VDSITKNLISKIPKEVSHVTNTLEKAGFEAYLVGGCVRDLLMSQMLNEIEVDKTPNDWDVTTNAKPEQIIGLFEKTVYENTFGTVAVVVSSFENTQDVSRETQEGNVSHVTENMIIEVTPYRTEAKYSDFRHPDEVKFSDKLEDDLKRRDFTVNAMALSPKGHLVDLFDGIKDIQDKTLRAVGNPDDRFAEDALRVLRAVRFSCQLNFVIAQETMESILKNSELIKQISFERIRDEFVKIIMSENSASGIVMLQKFNLLKNIIPELLEGIDCEQGGEHIYDVWNHLLHALQHAADKNWSLEIRLAALFHDIGKPKSRRLVGGQNVLEGTLGRSDGDGQRKFSAENFCGESENILSSKDSKKKFTFYGHEVVGARMAKKIMERLKFPKKEIELVEKLVRNHMFFSDTELITLSAVRRIITKVGVENIWLLMNVR
jgi:putative nucleotidyltransferase with HDIG domain